MKIPNNWTFKTEEIASEFDNHVREQLPWYELATDAVAHLAKHYIPNNGVVYDIGASTGNIGKSINDILIARKAALIPVEESKEMAERYDGPYINNLVISDVLDIKIEDFDVGIIFLTLMFLPVSIRYEWVASFYDKTRLGGAIIIVDKVETARGYLGTALGRLTLLGKVKNNVPKNEIIDKELSLAGIQRPITPYLLPGDPVEFFRYGDFAGWVIEKN